MATTIEFLLDQHSTNPVHDPDYYTGTNKAWTRHYEPIHRVSVHTRNQHGVYTADFDAVFGPEQADDTLRRQQAAYPPNVRSWRFETETDVKNWFHHEVANIVLAAWANYPNVVQISEAKPFTEQNLAETADDSYTIKLPHKGRTPLIIGEFKRGLISYRQWQRGHIEDSSQLSLSRELRGYAHKYECPQIFCFDHRTLLMLQFRARKPKNICDADCDVDCWVIPRENQGGTTLRYALYRFLVQGLRRFQGLEAIPNVSLFGYLPKFRQFYSGEAVWEVEGRLYKRPWDCQRVIEPYCGAFYWTRNGEEVQDEGGNRVWDTGAIY